ncbi:hypothetical protein HYE66_11535 [Aggregatibacter actinomycetemcomitans]|nr:hypothetical protein [Aggregatibacter actinomycetemcomitans]
MAYLRKAADLGNKNAQYELAENLERIQDRDTRALRLRIAEELLSCSSAQGMGKASESLGLSLQIDKKYDDAVKFFHQGVKNGDSLSSRFLAKSFGKNVSNTYFLALKNDPERSIRYKKIDEFLYRNDYLNPTVPDLDKIVPLPPAKLPAWDGKIAFQRWYEGPSPAKPSDVLMQKLADKAGLDVKTGLPLKKR